MVYQARKFYAKEESDKVILSHHSLFVSTSKLLQYIISQAWHNGKLQLPLDNYYGQNYPIIQYADDTLLIMLADIDQIQHIKTPLLQFSDATGLRVNFNKTTMVPINVPADTMDILANDFGCKIETLTFTYLGLPVGTSRPSVDDLRPLVSRLDKRLSIISSIMTYTGRLTVLNTTLNAIPVYAMCVLKTPVNIFVQFEKSGRQFLWAKKETHKHGKCLAKWDLVCRPKDQGGLGVLNLRL
jgi:hypothetical protein